MMIIRHNIQDDTFKFENPEYNVETGCYENIEDARELYDVLMAKSEKNRICSGDNVISSVGLPSSKEYYNHRI